MVKAEGSGYGTVGLSIGAVALITFVWPLLMGGSIALAVGFSEEILAKETPADANGFQWMEAGTCTSLGSMQSVVNSFDGDNWTVKSEATLSGIPNCNVNDSMVYSLKIPAEIVNHSDSMSKLYFRHVGAQYCNSCSGTWTYDYNMTINGSEVFTVNDKSINAYYETSSGNEHLQMAFTHELDGLELMKIRSEWGDCEPDCDVRLHFWDITEGPHTGNDYQNGQNPFPTGKVKMKAWTTDAELEGLIMTLSPWLVSVLTLAMAIGSTRYWNPLMGWFKS